MIRRYLYKLKFYFEVVLLAVRLIWQKERLRKVLKVVRYALNR